MRAVTYPDSGEALRARIDALQAELDAAHERIEHLEGESIRAEIARERLSSWFEGGFAPLTLDERLSFELDERAFEPIAHELRVRLDVPTFLVGKTLQSPDDRFSIRSARGVTRVRMRGDWGGSVRRW